MHFFSPAGSLSQRLAFYDALLEMVSNGQSIVLPLTLKAQHAGGHVFAYPGFDHTKPKNNVDTYLAALSAAEKGNIVYLRKETVTETYDALFNGDECAWELKLSYGTHRSIRNHISKANKQASHLWLYITTDIPINDLYRIAKGALLLSLKAGRVINLQEIHVGADLSYYIIKIADLNLKL